MDPVDPASIAVGAIVRAHALRGEVRVKLFSEDSRLLRRGARVFLDGRPYVIDAASDQQATWLVKLRGVDDRNAAEALQGRELSVLRAELPAAGDSEVYLADLVGCAVHDAAGALVGTVDAVENYGAQDLMVVRSAAGEVLIPFVEPIVVSVDLAARRITVDPPEGLLDLNARP